ncbi:hypothetical protein PAHA111176_23725 [Parendozoicomonas haliclonae]|uniref:Uncharacterized protein n=3 Tax=Parendozoicomonas haliclonae TaxID=1960125 RepID=A0A1X7AM90_9GAMM|nr:hypothetical protein EHSB41UT_02963 [Parendozoicomonas haliclonae]
MMIFPANIYALECDCEEMSESEKNQYKNECIELKESIHEELASNEEAFSQIINIANPNKRTIDNIQIALLNINENLSHEVDDFQECLAFMSSYGFTKPLSNEWINDHNAWKLLLSIKHNHERIHRGGYRHDLHAIIIGTPYKNYIDHINLKTNSM